MNGLKGILALALVATACGKGRTETWNREVSTAAVNADAAKSATERGDAAWAKRDDKAQLELAIAAWNEAVGQDPKNLELLTKLARGYYLLADGYLRADKEAYLATLEKGLDAAERAVSVASPEFEAKVKAGETVKDAIAVVGANGVPAMYWYSSNLGKWARAKGFSTTLGNKDTIRGVMERCLTLDRTFFHGGPDRYFGAFFAVAPSFAGGDLVKSDDHFQKSLASAPYYVGTKVLIADAYATKKQDKELYKKMLEEVIATNENDAIFVEKDLVPEVKIEKIKAKEFLAVIDEKF